MITRKEIALEKQDIYKKEQSLKPIKPWKKNVTVNRTVKNY